MSVFNCQRSSSTRVSCKFEIITCVSYLVQTSGRRSKRVQSRHVLNVFAIVQDEGSVDLADFVSQSSRL